MAGFDTSEKPLVVGVSIIKDLAFGLSIEIEPGLKIVGM